MSGEGTERTIKAAARRAANKFLTRYPAAPDSAEAAASVKRMTVQVNRLQRAQGADGRWSFSTRGMTQGGSLAGRLGADLIEKMMHGIENSRQLSRIMGSNGHMSTPSILANKDVLAAARSFAAFQATFS
jgi:hypothetical protein